MHMPSEDADDLLQRYACFKCIGEEFLSKEIRKQGKSSKCAYCGKTRRSYTLEELSDLTEGAFEQHYYRTSNEPDAIQWMMIKDKESSYDWEREGDQTVDAIANALLVENEIASDIQKILQDKHWDFDSAAMGEECEFDSDAYYAEKSVGVGEWEEEWSGFERTLKTEARFFSRSAVTLLESVFAGIEDMQTYDGRPAIVEAGPGTALAVVYRARVFQSDVLLKEALRHPERHLGPPPSSQAAAGRMNARGISVFYGAEDPAVARAEVRPPVGSKVVVARFEITRPLRLLDLTALPEVMTRGSIFDSAWTPRLQRAGFLRILSDRMIQPVMPDDEQSEYLPTQAIADYLATERDPSMDGKIFFLSSGIREMSERRFVS
jgi:RES domain